MKKNYYRLAVLTILIVSLVSLNVYAGKEHKCEKVELPDAVKAKVEKLYPKAEIEKVEMEDEDGITVYEIEVEEEDVETELTISSDGTLIEVEEEIEADALPEAIKQAVAGDEIEEAKKETNYWVVTSGILTKLDTPEVAYEVEVERDGVEMEIEFSPDGTVLEEKVLEDDDDDHGDDD